jgi:hypothetical protein
LLVDEKVDIQQLLPDNKPAKTSVLRRLLYVIIASIYAPNFVGDRGQDRPQQQLDYYIE